MPFKRRLYVRKDANESDWARRQFLDEMTTNEELRKFFVLPLWHQVRPVFLDWINLRKRAAAGEPVRDQFLPTSGGLPLFLAAYEQINSHARLWGAVKLANADGGWPDLIPLQEALERWALSIHLSGEEWVMLAALNIVWHWWERVYPDPEVDFDLFFGHADEADWQPDTGRFEFKDPGWLPWAHSAKDYRKSLEHEFRARLKTYIENAERTMNEAGYIQVACEWSTGALVWFGLHHCGRRTYSQIIALCKPNCGEPAIAKGVQQIRDALGVSPRPTVRGPDRRTRRSKAK